MSKPPQTQGVGFDVALAVKNACLCLHVQRAARSLARLFDEAFRPVGITNGQFSLLMSLNRPGPARMREVAKLLAMDRTTLTAALKTLERRGLLTVAVDPDDRRGRLLTLTDAGRDTLVRALPIWRDEHARLERGLADADGLRAALLAIS
jgi:DNA-binding MarR family transcriptional regulator